jgi:antitoxin FitA
MPQGKPKKHIRRAGGHFQEQKGGHEPIDMWSTCKYAEHMSRMIQLRNVPDALHRSLKARAAMAGMSLSDYLLSEIREVAQRPTLTELQQRLERRQPVTLREPAAVTVRAERDRR